MEDRLTKPVLVVGAGPVGLTVAVELARYRVPVRIIDKALSRTDKSKALAVWSRSLELLDRSGAAQTFAATGLKASGAVIRTRHDVIAEVSFDLLPSPFPYVLLIPQSESERLLEERLNGLGVQVERNVELISLSDAGSGVTGAVDHADGRAETIEASWLIGCDGAHSIVRHTLGESFDGDTFGSNFILADVHLASRDISETKITLFWHEDGVLALFPIAPGRFRIIADVGSAPRHDPTLAEAQAIVDQRGPGEVALTDPVWMAGFSVNERMVSDYRAGRVFLAGDAAHVHSPAGGQGMNTGMQDAFNLAWKLALVEAGAAKATLLDSYSPERAAVARQILSDSGRMTRAATIRNRMVQDIRNFVAHRILGFADVQHAIAGRLSELTISYPKSPLNRGDADGLKGPGPGERIVDARPFGAGVAPRFALMGIESAEMHGLLDAHASLLEPELRAPPDENGLWLVRPDGYVAAVAWAGQRHAVSEALVAIAV
jgi:2-polyprenyl-6-methoxyphenol hydroxylase-like FAD-dependent oxidoreductase